MAYSRRWGVVLLPWVLVLSVSSQQSWSRLGTLVGLVLRWLAHRASPSWLVLTTTCLRPSANFTRVGGLHTLLFCFRGSFPPRSSYFGRSTTACEGRIKAWWMQRSSS